MMQTLNVDAVVDELVAELAQRRQRERAYQALARAILVDEPFEEEQVA
jgi:hypothetical protein